MIRGLVGDCFLLKSDSSHSEKSYIKKSRFSQIRTKRESVCGPNTTEKTLEMSFFNTFGFYHICDER